jgi:hypothetical protein
MRIAAVEVTLDNSARPTVITVLIRPNGIVRKETRSRPLAARHEG